MDRTDLVIENIMGSDALFVTIRAMRVKILRFD